MTVDATSADDASAVSSLQLGSFSTFATNDPALGEVVDTNGTANNQFLDLSRANAKALDLIGDDGSSDGSFTFNSA